MREHEQGQRQTPAERGAWHGSPSQDPGTMTWAKGRRTDAYWLSHPDAPSWIVLNTDGLKWAELCFPQKRCSSPNPHIREYGVGSRVFAGILRLRWGPGEEIPRICITRKRLFFPSLTFLFFIFFFCICMRWWVWPALSVLTSSLHMEVKWLRYTPHWHSTGLYQQWTLSQ